MRTKTRGGRARLPKFASPRSTTQSLHFLNHELEKANRENCIGRMALGTSSKMNDDVGVASAYSDDGTDIPVENHSGLGLSGDCCMDADSLEEEPCIKCNSRDGNLLICGQSGCPISVHERCMKFGLKFDDVGNFYCPYCWYKRELMRTKELRKKAMETKKQLACFLDVKRAVGDKEENSRSDKGKELNMSSLGGEINCGDDDYEDTMDSDQVENQSLEVEEDLENDLVNAKPADSLDQFKTAVENQSDPLAPLFHRGDKINHNEARTPRVESLVNSTSKERPNEENVSETRDFEFLEDGETVQVEDLGQVDDSGHEKIVEDQLLEDPHSACCVEERNAVDDSLSKLDTVKLKEGRREEEEKIALPRKLGTKMSDSNKVRFSLRLKRVAGSSKKAQSWTWSDSPKKLSAPKDANPEKSKSHNVDSSKKLSSPKCANPEHIARARNEKATASKKSTQVPGGKFTNFAFASEKRRRLHWTAEEEEMLKEGVQKVSTKINKNLPWRKVLEFGSHVFDPTRTPSDLKDKWRNIMAKESLGISK